MHAVAAPALSVAALAERNMEHLFGEDLSVLSPRLGGAAQRAAAISGFICR